MCFVFLQNIAFYEWLPAYLGKQVSSYPGELCVCECARAQVIGGLFQSQMTHLLKVTLEFKFHSLPLTYHIKVHLMCFFRYRPCSV